MLDVQEAVEKASIYCKKMFRSSGATNIELEEVELSEDEAYWLITLSFTLPLLGTFLPEVVTGKRRTKYKVFKVESETGNVVSVKIRKMD